MDRILRRPEAEARRVIRRGDALYVGWTAPGRSGNGVEIVDVATGAPRVLRSTAYLVSDVAFANGGHCYAALGPGQLVDWPDIDGSDDATVTNVDANAPRLVVHDDALYWGTFWGEIHALRGGRIAGVRTSQGGVAVDGRRVYAGYKDGKIRAWTHAGKRAAVIEAGSGYPRVAAGPGGVYAAHRTGDIVRYDPETLAEISRSRVEPGVYGVTLRVTDDGRLVAWGRGQPVRLLDPDGALLFEQAVGDGRVEDVTLDGDVLWVAAGGEVWRLPMA
ncbi:MAG: hypothetical protein ABMB14_27615 [Myxococcota bacterium]